jgi:hypothetical protein
MACSGANFTFAPVYPLLNAELSGPAALVLIVNVFPMLVRASGMRLHWSSGSDDVAELYVLYDGG